MSIGPARRIKINYHMVEDKLICKELNVKFPKKAGETYENIQMAVMHPVSRSPCLLYGKCSVLCEN